MISIKQLYWNRTSAWLFSCKFAAFQNVPSLKSTSDRLLLLLAQLKKRVEMFRSSYPDEFLGKGVLKIYSKFTGEHPSKCDFNKEITLRHGCSLVNLLQIFRAPFNKNTSGRLLLNVSNLLEN